MIGTTISHYRITEKLGEGGMGVVYKAEDTKLERTVALKFLAAHLLNDEEAKARFLREAKAAAGLHHPNICPVYEIGESEGRTFLSMAFIEGESLEARIEQGPLPLKDALDIGRQIAEGLEAAHEKGVVHRDIKPANVMVDAKGRATIMDFGLAQLTEASRLTKANQTMGTVAYMSPEQAQGMEVDRRSDIWALGVVLYEMVRGHRPFQGQYDQALLYEIVHQEPEPLTGVRAGVPMELEFIVGRCLTKDREDRPGSAQEIARDVRTLGDKLKSGRSTIMQAASGSVGARHAVPAVATGAHAGLEQPANASPETNLKLPWAIAALAVVASAVFAFLHLTEIPFELSTYEFGVSLPEAARIHTLSLSPDGRHLAVALRSEGESSPLLVRSLDSLEIRELAGTDGGTFPFWSPDSRYIGFFAQGKLKKIALAGGPAQSLCDARDGRGGSWNEDGVIVFAPNPFGGFERVSAGGGEPVRVVTGDESTEASQRFPYFLPDGRHFLYSGRAPGADGDIRILLGSIDGQPTKQLLNDDSNAVYVPGSSADEGFILFFREGSLMAQPFDAAGLELAGDLFPVLEGVGGARYIGNYGFSAAINGTLAAAGRSTRPEVQLAWFDRQGSEMERIGKPQNIRGLDLSPNEKRVALSIRQDDSWDIWIHELERGTMSRLTSDPSWDAGPAWSPDGGRISFATGREGTSATYTKPTGGAGDAEPLLPPDLRVPFTSLCDWPRNGLPLLCGVQGANTSGDIWAFPLDGEPPSPFLATEFREGGARFSPDTRWVAYGSDQSGRLEVYMRPFPEGDREWKVSTEGGTQPRWRGDGKELYYIDPDGTLMAVSIEAGDAIKAGVPEALFLTRIRKQASGVHMPVYDVTSDGKRFLIGNRVGEATGTSITVISNWQAKVQN